MPDLVLITGGAGFIGAHTSRHLLHAGFRVRALDSLHPQVHAGGEAPAYLPADVELMRGDVRDIDAVRSAVAGVDLVLHLAAETSVGQSRYAGDRHVDVNARGTAVVLQALQETPSVRRFVLSSSRAVYGEGLHRCARCGVVTPSPRSPDTLRTGRWRHSCPQCGAPVEPMATHEDAPLAPASVYGLTKRFQEDLARLDAAQLQLDVGILRYANVYGPWQSVGNPYTGLITTLAVRLAAGKQVVLYEGGLPVRDFVHVDDVARANVSALRASGRGLEVVNIGSGTGTTLRELAEALGGAFGRSPEVELSNRFRIGDVFASVLDIRRARERLSFAPQITLGDGLRSIADWLDGVALDDASDEVEAEMRRRGVLGEAVG